MKIGIDIDGVILDYERVLKTYGDIYDFVELKKDGLVNSVTTKETVESDNEQVRSYFKKTLEDSYNTANENYGGYTYNVTEDGNKVISDVTIDYSKMDLDKFVNDNSQMKSYIKNNKISLDGMKKIYEALGATCN